mgnify:CR=1 FL=1
MGAKSDVVVKLILVFFISLLSFAIGTFVGKKYSDNQYKLAKLEPEAKETHGADKHAERNVASAEGDKTGHGEQGNAHEAKSEMISDDEIKKLTDETLKKEEFVADDSAEKSSAAKHDVHATAHEKADVKKEVTHEGAHSEVAKTEKAHSEPAKKATEVKKEHVVPTAAHGQTSKKETSKGAEGHDEALAAAQAFLDGKTPEVKEEVKKETRLPSSLPKDVAQYAVGKFTVQVASYAEKVDAEKKSSKLKEMGYQTNIFTAQVNGKIWYRVSFGLFATQEEALAEKAKFLDKNKTESALVQKIKN